MESSTLGPGEARRKAARAALDAYERSLGRTKDGMTREALLSFVATVAVEAGENEKARTYATELLEKAGNSKEEYWNRGNAVHYGHLVSGRIALIDGDLKAAKAHLLRAGQTPGSPNLGSFGPNMTLAKELLEKGERQIVLEYFKLCHTFWKDEKLEEWSSVVRAGRVPDFGANLNY